MTDRTEQAAQRCADLANVGRDIACYAPESFIESGPVYEAFRRYVERKDAEAREVLRLRSLGRDVEADNLLRADLLPQPKPDVLAEAIQAVWNYATGCERMPPERARQLRAELAKRGVEVKP